MQIYLYRINVILILVFSFIFIGCSEDNEDFPERIIEPEPLKYGTVSGRVVDANTSNPLSGSVVKLYGLEIKTEPDGLFAFQGIPYDVEQELTVTDPDYQTNKQIITLSNERLIVNVDLIPLIDTEEELNEFFDSFSELIETIDSENIPAIQSHFSESYVASDDPITMFGVLSGVIPPNYDTIRPTITELFMDYSWLEFSFKDKEMDIRDARKGAVQLVLDVDSEGAEDKILRHLQAHSLFELRREGGDWKIVYWELLQLDIGA
ncbi:carboxypeptidase regulatory-like domain-containing protein [Candidatus Poribacteria bacterium]|nr:carboxypeptidase regulatory-like domain-containing protein [Candidatus Poribacteria bacterium]